MSNILQVTIEENARDFNYIIDKDIIGRVDVWDSKTEDLIWIALKENNSEKETRFAKLEEVSRPTERQMEAEVMEAEAIRKLKQFQWLVLAE